MVLYLIIDYIQVIPFHVGLVCSLQVPDTPISRGDHVLACTPEMTSFIHGDMAKQVWGKFSILLLESNVIRA